MSLEKIANDIAMAATLGAGVYGLYWLSGFGFKTKAKEDNKENSIPMSRPIEAIETKKTYTTKVIPDNYK